MGAGGGAPFKEIFPKRKTKRSIECVLVFPELGHQSNMAAMEKLLVHLFVALPPSPTLPKSPAFSFIIDNHNGKC